MESFAAASFRASRALIFSSSVVMSPLAEESWRKGRRGREKRSRTETVTAVQLFLEFHVHAIKEI